MNAKELIDTAKAVIAEVEAFHKEVLVQFDEPAPGNMEAQGPVFVQWFMQKCGVGVTPEMLATPDEMGFQQFFPPEPIVLPTGETVMNSPWLLALPLLEDGKGIKEIRKFERLTGADMRWVEQMAGKPIRRMGPYEKAEDALLAMQQEGVM